MFTDFGSDLVGLTAFMTPDYRQLVDGREMTRVQQGHDGDDALGSLQ